MDDYSLSMRCSEYIENISFDNLPADVIRMAKLCILDFLGCVISGSATKEGNIIIDLAEETSGRTEATIAGKWTKANMLNAALANGYNCHIHEMDDVHKGSVLHPAAPVIASALAAAEAHKKTGKELIEAIVAGYDVVMRIGEAVSPSHYYFWHTTGTCGTFGAAVSAGKLLGLTKGQMVNALGNAGSQASGLWQFIEDNAMTKYLHCGKAAYNGLLSALLAQRGFTGAKRILEGERGFVKATSSEKNPENSFATLGQQYKIRETSFKPYASCRHTHSTVDAILSLKDKYHLEAQDVDRITINIYKTATMIAQNNERYEDARAARFSLVYCAAAALYFGGLTLRAFLPDALNNPKILRIAKNTKISIDEDLNKLYPGKWPAHVTIEAKGKKYEKLVEYPKGDPENPLTLKDFEQKFMGLVIPAMKETAAYNLMEKCQKLETVEDISKFFQGDVLN